MSVEVEDRRHRPRVLKVRRCLLFGSCWFCAWLTEGHAYRLSMGDILVRNRRARCVLLFLLYRVLGMHSQT